MLLSIQGQHPLWKRQDGHRSFFSAYFVNSQPELHFSQSHIQKESSAIRIFRLRCQDAKGQRSYGKYQHEYGRPNAFNIANKQMGRGGSHEIEDQTDSRRNSNWRPSDSNKESYSASELASSQYGKVLQWHADSFMDDLNLTRIAPDLADAGKWNHEREQHSNHEVRSMHLDARLPLESRSLLHQKKSLPQVYTIYLFSSKGFE
jgi:hypothetical protein